MRLNSIHNVRRLSDRELADLLASVEAAVRHHRRNLAVDQERVHPMSDAQDLYRWERTRELLEISLESLLFLTEEQARRRLGEAA